MTYSHINFTECQFHGYYFLPQRKKTLSRFCSFLLLVFLTVLVAFLFGRLLPYVLFLMATMLSKQSHENVSKSSRSQHFSFKYLCSSLTKKKELLKVCPLQRKHISQYTYSGSIQSHARVTYDHGPNRFASYKRDLQQKLSQFSIQHFFQPNFHLRNSGSDHFVYLTCSL